MNTTRILIVEDSPTQSQRLSNLLKQNQFDVIIAKNGQDALNIIDQVNPILLISDIIMPEMDGYQLCKKLRMKSKFEKLPIILLTTLSDPEDIINGLECGANYFIVKPYEDDFLIRHVEEVLNIRNLRLNEEEDKSVKILLHGNEHTVTANKAQILDLLVSIYEAALSKNEQLSKAQLELHELNSALEHRVEDRTKDLKLKMLENEKLYEELKAYTTKIELYLKEREEILKEIYHRVKNNLQIISSLLSLQVDSTADCGAKSILIKSAARIKSMALVHELLYQSKNLAKISMKTYSNQLVHYLYDLYEIDAKHITLIDDGEDVDFKIEKAVSCGLIMNEIITNSLRHAFASNQHGEIHFAFKNEDKNVVLSISDNGRGIPENFAIDKTHSLGMNLIFNLAKQLDGKVAMERDQGTRFKLIFPKESITD